MRMDDVDAQAASQRASSGHKLGQLVGDWFERYFALPLIQGVAKQLNLFADNRYVERIARGEKLYWPDGDGNQVDYDFVLELGGSPERLGIPVAFFESFWRRGARHSKDKARDDTGKLLPMREFHPTARFLGIVAAGTFTGPASELVSSRKVDLFYVPKGKVVDAFSRHGLVMDYDDRAPEPEKARLAAAFDAGLTDRVKPEVASTLTELIGHETVRSYAYRVRSALGALPQEVRFSAIHRSEPVVFRSLSDAAEFLAHDPSFAMSNPSESFAYEITYSDGSEFSRECESIQGLKKLHGQMVALAEHMEQQV